MDRLQRYPTRLWLLSCLLTAFVLAGCPQTPTADPIEPTRTPMPTFTPTTAVAASELPVVEVPATTVAQLPTDAAPVAPVVAAPAITGGLTTTDTAQPVAPPATATPAAAEAVIGQGMNVRGGPGTTYAIIGAAQSGDRFIIKGKDPTGAWWQVDFNGQNGWLFGELVTANNTSGVAVAQNIPAPPPPTATPIPQPTQPPAQPTQPPADQPTQAPAPPPAPANNYKFNIVVVSKCARQPAGNWFEGKTYIGGQPASGYKVVFSYAPDAPPITSPVVSGPHPGYEGWDAGYYSHIINASGAKAGEWYVWVVDDGGARISEIGHWTSTGPGDACNQAVVDFDSR